MDNSTQNESVVDQEIDGEMDNVSELDLLKTQARQMGLAFSPNIGVDTLRKKVRERIEGVASELEEEPEAAAPLSKLAAKANLRQDMIKKQMKLVRLRITNLNPSKKELSGEIFTVGNKYIGSVKKFVAFGDATDDGYHVPYIIYNQLKNREFLSVTTKRNRVNGNIDITQRWVKEFALEVLPPLNAKELEKLAATQAASKGIA